MCNLTTPLDKESVIGYKVVAIKDGKHYSPSTGICYEDYEEMPEVRKPSPLCFAISQSDISPNGLFYSNEMVGRTAVFTDVQNALDLEQYLNRLPVYGYCIKTVKVEVSKDLMKGDLHLGLWRYASVVAGRKIKFLED